MVQIDIRPPSNLPDASGNPVAPVRSNRFARPAPIYHFHDSLPAELHMPRGVKLSPQEKRDVDRRHFIMFSDTSTSYRDANSLFIQKLSGYFTRLKVSSSDRSLIALDLLF
jgi:hypothetical protein